MKLGVRYYLDPAIRGLSGDLADAAEVMFTRGLARAGEVSDGGFIPKQDVELLTRRRRYGAVVDALLRSGLWTVVAGGYQVTRWSDWQDHLDALARKRTADRDRQRRRRAAADKGSTSEDRQPPNLSRDPSRDVTDAEGEGEGEVLGVQGGDTGTARPSTSAAPPPVDNPPNHTPALPGRCPRHATDPDPPNCGGCRDARLAAQQAERDQVAARQDADRAARDGPKCRTCRHPTSSHYHRTVCQEETDP